MRWSRICQTISQSPLYTRWPWRPWSAKKLPPHHQSCPALQRRRQRRRDDPFLDTFKSHALVLVKKVSVSLFCVLLLGVGPDGTYRRRFDSGIRVTPSFCLRRSLPKKHNPIKSSKKTRRLFRLQESARVVPAREGVKEMSTDTIGSHPTFIYPDRG